MAAVQPEPWLWALITNKRQVQQEKPETGESHSNLVVLLFCTSPSVSLNLLSEQFPKPPALHTFSTDMQHKMYAQQNTTTVHTVSPNTFS
jgi:hypothetical protein